MCTSLRTSLACLLAVSLSLSPFFTSPLLYLLYPPKAARPNQGLSFHVSICTRHTFLQYIPSRMSTKGYCIQGGFNYPALNVQDCLHCYQLSQVLRSAREALLMEPSVKEARVASTRHRAFSMVAPVRWNSLPFEARQAPSCLSFRRLVRMELFYWAFSGE